MHTDEADNRHMSLEHFEEAAAKDTKWLNNANCREYDTDLMFDMQKLADKETEIEVLDTCSLCPVRRDCFDMIMTFESAQEKLSGHGLFAGLKPTQRVIIKNKYKNIEDQYNASTIYINTRLSQLRSRLAVKNAKAMKVRRLALKVNQERKIDSKTIICQEHDYIAVRNQYVRRNGKHTVQYLCIKNSEHYLYSE
jgi:hypothetical protein